MIRNILIAGCVLVTVFIVALGAAFAVSPDAPWKRAGEQQLITDRARAAEYTSAVAKFYSSNQTNQDVSILSAAFDLATLEVRRDSHSGPDIQKVATAWEAHRMSCFDAAAKNDYSLIAGCVAGLADTMNALAPFLPTPTPMPTETPRPPTQTAVPPGIATAAAAAAAAANAAAQANASATAVAERNAATAAAAAAAAAAIQATAAAVPQATANAKGIVGQVVDTDKYGGEKVRVTVRSVQETQEIGSSSARGKYVVLLVTTTCKTSGGCTSDEDNYRLQDDKGRRYPMAVSVLRDAGDQFYRDIPIYDYVASGKSVEEVFVFDAEPDAANYKLTPAQE